MMIWFSVPVWTGYGYLKLGPSPPCGHEYQMHDLIPGNWSYIVQNFTVSWDMDNTQTLYVMQLLSHDNYGVNMYDDYAT